MSRLDDLFAGKPEMLNVAAVADLLGMSVKGVYKWIEDGTVPAYKLGGKWFLVRDELPDALRKGASQPGEPPQH